ncbi:type III polyketide synthase [Oleisolibacter albus]|uniref:type III polyketide synthase n=1 Tax=Oleisolibacter albus TaxID=2171757 RepID=UPI000DF419A0|nr:type III polyketide synthase [Oleisolibacter albus]
MPTAHLLGLATATPPHRLTQEQTREVARSVFADHMRDFERLAPVFTNAGIDSRQSCVPLDWYRTRHGWRDRTALYLGHALELLDRATRAALARADLEPGCIDAIVCVSSTGIATPSLDARVIQRLGLRPDVQRLPVFGLGCAGGVLGLARAADWARARPGSTVLLLVVELCALSFRRDDVSNANVVATALFGDGAAAVLLRAPGPEPGTGPETGAPPGPALRATAEHTWPDTLDVMGWRVEEDGLGVIFSQSIPALVRLRFGAVVDRFLDSQGLDRGRLTGSICHPGGAKVIDSLEEVLAPCTAGMEEARTVLRDHGNMSAATVLFVLERRIASGARGPHLMTALGPGFSAGLALLDL